MPAPRVTSRPTPRPRRARLATALAACVSGAALSLTALSPLPSYATETTQQPEAPQVSGTTEVSDEAGATESAEASLAQVQQIVEGTPVPEGVPTDGAGTPEDLSLALRDLALQLPALDRSDRRDARRLLARPTSFYEGDVVAYEPGAELSTDCGPRVCVHWVQDAPDAPPTRDSDADSVPDQVEVTRAAVEDVWTRTRAMGYRAPLPDDVAVDDPDGAPRFDVYLADLGNLPGGALFGYCAWESKAGYDFAGSGYCVLDNDFSARQFGGAPPLQSLLETVAHEFFHAVQFGYDAVEDLWFMESSATWMEGQLFDDANGNRNYLRQSQLRHPRRPLDAPAARYGSWVFLQWLSEKFGPRIVLDTWRQADSVDGPDLWAMQAVEVALRTRGTSLDRELPAYAQSLRFADTDFEEGSESPLWAPAAPDRVLALSRRAPGATIDDLRVGQLASVAVAVPTRRATSAMRRLVVAVDGPPRKRGVRVELVKVRNNGQRVTKRVRTDARGDGVARIGFRRASVDQVYVVATGTSTRMECWKGTSFSCEGTRVDHSLPLSLRVLGR